MVSIHSHLAAKPIAFGLNRNRNLTHNLNLSTTMKGIKMKSKIKIKIKKAWLTVTACCAIVSGARAADYENHATPLPNDHTWRQTPHREQRT